MAERSITPASIPGRQLAALCGYSLVIWSLGNGILPLLPTLASILGANPTATGIYLALAYASIALGAWTAGWLAKRVAHRRWLMLGVGLAGPPFVVATSAVGEFWELIALTAVVWWLGGTALALANILGGLGAGATERGRVLGLLAMMGPAGSIVGGLGVGVLADQLGYARMWIVLGLLWLLCPAAGVFIRDPAPAPRGDARALATARGMWTPAFTFLLACGLIGAVGSFVGSIGRSLAMKDVFSAAALDSTVVVSGLVTIPFPLVLGILSDRLGRVRFIGLCYAAGVGGLLVYAAAGSLAEFWLAASLVAFVSYVAPGVASALVVDVVDRGAVPQGLALFGAMGWVGGVLGFGMGGYAYGHVGQAGTFLLGAIIVVAGLALLWPVTLALRPRRPRDPGPDSAQRPARKG